MTKEETDFLTNLKVNMITIGVIHISLDASIDGTTGYIDFTTHNGKKYSFDSQDIEKFWP